MDLDLSGLSISELKKVIRYYNFHNDIKDINNRTKEELIKAINYCLFMKDNKVTIKERGTEWKIDDMKNYKKVLKKKKEELIVNKEKQEELKQEAEELKEDIKDIKEKIEDKKEEEISGGMIKRKKRDYKFNYYK
jgi:seryl-tRNA synthetase